MRVYGVISGGFSILYGYIGVIWGGYRVIGVLGVI